MAISNTQMTLMGMTATGALALLIAQLNYAIKEESTILFPKSAPFETMIPFAVALFFLGMASYGSYSKIAKHTQILEIMTIGTAAAALGCCFALFNGFGAEHMVGEGLTQPAGWQEKTTYGALWGGMLTLSTATFAWGVKEVRETLRAHATNK